MIECERSTYDPHWCARHRADFSSEESRCERGLDLEAARTFARESHLVQLRRPDARAARRASPDDYSVSLLLLAVRSERCGCCGQVETLDQRLACERESSDGERRGQRRGEDQ